MTWIEVASDAVKIGLGAIVGGVFVIIAARQSHGIRLREEYSRRRRDQLERISEAFDSATRIATDYVAHILSIASVRASAEEKEAISGALGHDVLGDHEQVMQVLHELHSIEARLALLALPHISEEVEKFRFALTEVSMKGTSPSGARKKQNKELSEFLQTQRTIIVTLMAIAYKDA
jgi:gas vesicle protein